MTDESVCVLVYVCEMNVWWCDDMTLCEPTCSRGAVGVALSNPILAFLWKGGLDPRTAPCSFVHCVSQSNWVAQRISFFFLWGRLLAFLSSKKSIQTKIVWAVSTVTMTQVVRIYREALRVIFASMQHTLHVNVHICYYFLEKESMAL